MERMRKIPIDAINSKKWEAGAARLYNTTIKTEDVAPQSERELLYRKLAFLGKDGSAKKVLNEYIMEGKSPKKRDLIDCAKELRKYNQHRQALEILEWLDRRKIQFSRLDHALRIDLTAKTMGITVAKNYLENLALPLRNSMTYGCLLNSYCKELMVEEALLLFEKMDELCLLKSSIPFNNLMTMYLRLNQPEKMIKLVEEMRTRNIFPDRFTYNMRMQCYSCLGDIEKVEKVFDEMLNDENVRCDWTSFSNLAAIYTKFGLLEKAATTLTTLEAEMCPKNREAYHFLICMYATLLNSEEVHRLWNSLKSNFRKITNHTYCVLFSAFSRLHDLESLRKCFAEWESSCSYYDAKVANLVIKAYLDHDKYEEGMSVFENASSRCEGKLFTARQMLCAFALKCNNIDLAMEHFRSGFSECQSAGLEWKPKHNIVDAFFRHFREEEDADGAEQFCELLRLANLMDSGASRSLQSVYEAAGRHT